MNTNPLFSLYFHGGDVAPETVSAKELAELLKATEDAIVYASRALKPENNDPVSVNLISIERGSLALGLYSSKQNPVLQAFTAITTAIANKNYVRLPNKTIAALKSIRVFTRKKQCAAHFVDANRQHIASITAQSAIPENTLITELTTIYGKVVRTGGKTKPRIMLESIDGTTIYCDTDTDTARQLGSRLYKTVGLRGTAQLDRSDFSVQSFRISEILEYQEHTAAEGLSALSKIIGKYFADINDVPAFVAKLRN